PGSIRSSSWPTRSRNGRTSSVVPSMKSPLCLVPGPLSVGCNLPGTRDRGQGTKSRGVERAPAAEDEPGDEQDQEQGAQAAERAGVGAVVVVAVARPAEHQQDHNQQNQ